MNIALCRFLHNHGNNATEGSPDQGLCPSLISNDFKGSILCTVPCTPDRCTVCRAGAKHMQCE